MKQCLNCQNYFKALEKETKRGNAKFCSLKCSAIYNNRLRPTVSLNCHFCHQPFESKNKKAKFCSVRCGQANRFTGKYRNHHLNEKINRFISTSICFNCGWNKDVCDIHHIIERNKGGTDDFNNLVIVCPNCHRLIHSNKIDILTIKTVSKKLVELGKI